MKSRTGPGRVRVVVGGGSLASCAGGVLLVETARASGLDRGLRAGLRPWRTRRALHEPGRVLLDLATAVARRGLPADVGVVRAQPELFGPVASDPTVSRLIDRLADTADTAVAAIRAARAAAWAHRCPVPAQGLV